MVRKFLVALLLFCFTSVDINAEEFSGKVYAVGISISKEVRLETDEGKVYKLHFKDEQALEATGFKNQGDELHYKLMRENGYAFVSGTVREPHKFDLRVDNIYVIYSKNKLSKFTGQISVSENSAILFSNEYRMYTCIDKNRAFITLNKDEQAKLSNRTFIVGSIVDVKEKDHLNQTERLNIEFIKTYYWPKELDGKMFKYSGETKVVQGVTLMKEQGKNQYYFPGSNVPAMFIDLGDDGILAETTQIVNGVVYAYNHKLRVWKATDRKPWENKLDEKLPK